MIQILFTLVAGFIALSQAHVFVNISEPYVPEIFEPQLHFGSNRIIEAILLGQNGNDALRMEFREKRNAVKRPERKWPNNTIPFAFATKYPESMVNDITYAMKAIENNTCIRFVDVSDISQNFIVFAAHPDGTVCATPIGYYKKEYTQDHNGYQVVYLSHTDQGTCLTHGTIVHELMHAIGLNHEHNRSDRDDFITVYVENVNPGWLDNYEKGTTYEFFDYGCPYNYESIMHYRKTSFGKEFANGTQLQTMETKDPRFSDIIGKAEKAHPTDYEKINRMYKCGIVAEGHTCSAEIPEPDLCEDDPNISPKDFCISQFAQNLAACDSHPQAKEFCPKTCQFCKDRKPFCLDNTNNVAFCANVVQEKQCDDNPKAKKYCKKSCNFC